MADSGNLEVDIFEEGVHYSLYVKYYFSQYEQKLACIYCLGFCQHEQFPKCFEHFITNCHFHPSVDKLKETAFRQQ